MVAKEPKTSDEPKYPKFVPGPSFRERWLPRLIIVSGLVIALGAFWAAGRIGDTSGSDPVLDQAVESVFPTKDSLEPRQTRVSIDLANEWELVRFTIDGQPIPAASVNTSGAALGQYSFLPGPDTVFEVFDVGEITVVAVIQNQLDDEIRTIEWSFTST